MDATNAIIKCYRRNAMNNKGQITVFISLVLCILLLFTFTAFEGIRIYTGKVKAASCVHSVHTGIMADYDRELFDRYGLLFIDTTYGTDSDAYLEEKISDYLETSLNGETKNTIYSYNIEDILTTDKVGILDDDMQQLKNQIVEYEKHAGLMDLIDRLENEVSQTSDDIENAYEDTQREAKEKKDENTQENGNQERSDGEVKDPRDELSSMLKGGMLNIVMPQNTLSTKMYPFDAAYNESTDDKDTDFQDIGKMKTVLNTSISQNKYSVLQEQAAFLNYIQTHFSNGVNSMENSVVKCEMEYMLMGKNSDYANMEAVVSNLIWMRMPVNYAYLLSDTVKKEEAEAVAIAICTATGTLEFEKVVQYLLLGCWAYAESIYEVRNLLAGGKVSYVKSASTWSTDLNNLALSKDKKSDSGLSYNDYLLLMFGMKSKNQINVCYSRMLDLMELNIQQSNPNFQIENCVGSFYMQGKISGSELSIAENQYITKKIQDSVFFPFR